MNNVIFIIYLKVKCYKVVVNIVVYIHKRRKTKHHTFDFT